MAAPKPPEHLRTASSLHQQQTPDDICPITLITYCHDFCCSALRCYAVASCTYAMPRLTPYSPQNLPFIDVKRPSITSKTTFPKVVMWWRTPRIPQRESRVQSAPTIPLPPLTRSDQFALRRTVLPKLRGYSTQDVAERAPRLT